MNVLKVVRRVAPSIAIGAALVVGSSGIVLADTQTGQTGNYSMRDADQNNPSVTCKYGGAQPTFHLKSVVVKAPYLWWPDTDSSVNNQHGQVGYKAILRVSLSGAYGPWTTIKKSPLHQGTAYEDRPAYDTSDAASLDNHTFSLDPSDYASHPDAYVSVRIKAYWYKPSGSTLGSVVHDDFYYRYKYPNGTTENWTTACPIKYEPA